MPAAPEHPVTLGDLFVKDGSETFISLAVRPATVADLVSALRAEAERSDFWVVGEYDIFTIIMKSALAEAQPFPPAGR